MQNWTLVLLNEGGTFVFKYLRLFYLTPIYVLLIFCSSYQKEWINDRQPDNEICKSCVQLHLPVLKHDDGGGVAYQAKHSAA